MEYIPERKPYKFVSRGPHFILSSVPPGSSVTYNYLPDTAPAASEETKRLTPAQDGGAPGASDGKGTGDAPQDGTGS
jgi:hypothetical protein